MIEFIICASLFTVVAGFIIYKKLKNEKPSSGISERAGGRGKQR